MTEKKAPAKRTKKIPRTELIAGILSRFVESQGEAVLPADYCEKVIGIAEERVVNSLTTEQLESVVLWEYVQSATAFSQILEQMTAQAKAQPAPALITPNRATRRKR